MDELEMTEKELNDDEKRLEVFISYIRYFFEKGEADKTLSILDQLRVSYMFDLLDKIELDISEEEFPNVFNQYDKESMKLCSVSMCYAQKMKITKKNMISALINLESDLE